MHAARIVIEETFSSIAAAAGGGAPCGSLSSTPTLEEGLAVPVPLAALSAITFSDSVADADDEGDVDAARSLLFFLPVGPAE
jgi:hypothetical protein